MSGIAGIYYQDSRPINRNDLQQMVDRLNHRGSDGSGVWSLGTVGLGHCMLWTTPESIEEKLPLVNSTQNLVLTADARIDNRDELIALYELEDQPSREISDSELILKAYEKWGEGCLQKLIGDFAFAIWDESKQQLFCVRDHIGVKPFYYYRSTKLFAFASEIKALFALPEVPRQLNEAHLADLLTGLYEAKTETLYQGIYRLPPAHVMIVKHEGVRLHPYWSADLTKELHLGSDEEYADSFREIFTEAVRCRLRSAYPVGSTLSGGLDSSSIACTSRDLLAGNGGPPLHTFSAVYPNLPEPERSRVDESSYIDKVVSTGGFEPHLIQVDQVSPLVDLDLQVRQLDEVYFAPNLSMHWSIYDAAQRQGMRVILDGMDGDDTVSHGLDYLADLFRVGKFRTLYTEAEALSHKTLSTSPTRKIIWQYGIRPVIPGTILNMWRVLNRRNHSSLAEKAINPDFARRVNLEKRVGEYNNNSRFNNFRQKHWRNIDSALTSYSLELLDKTAATFSLDPRYPFYDWRLIKFCLALPPRQILSNGMTRVIFRRAMAGVIPEEVRWRTTKADLSINFRYGLFTYERPIIEQVILNNPQYIEPYFDIQSLKNTYQRFITQPLLSMRTAQIVYNAVILDRWLHLLN